MITEKISTMLLATLFCAALFLTGCGATASLTGGGKSTYPATEDGAKALLKEFTKPGADLKELSKQLRPTKEDYEAIFKPEFAAKAMQIYEPAWESGNLVIDPSGAKRTEIILYGGTSDDIINWTGEPSKNFAGGWKEVAPHLKPGNKFYRFDFVEPGETVGMHYEGLININGNWRVFPKPWRIGN